MKNFSYVIYNNKLCVLVDHNDKIATIAGVMQYSPNAYFSYEYDVPMSEISLANIEVLPCSIIYRLRDYRMVHDDSLGFMEEELSRIHSFNGIY